MSFSDMLSVAQDCVKHPNRRAVWSPELKKYVCPDQFAEQEIKLDYNSRTHPPISPQFKLVFLTAAGGTLLFALLCVVLTISTGGQMPGALEKLVNGFFDLVKIGFGAVVGLLGGQQLQGDKQIPNQINQL